MKSLFLIVSLLIFANVESQSVRSGSIQYIVSPVPRDLSKLEKRAKESNASSTVLTLFKNSEPVEATLIFTNEESMYSVDKKLKNEASKNINMIEVFAGAENLHYVNQKEKLAYSTFDSYEKGLMVDHSKGNWRLLNETKKIGDYECFKASWDEKKATAWYALEIPLPFGPKEFHGLPGLILELETNIARFSAKKIILNQKRSKNIQRPKGKRISQKEFREKTKGFFQN